MNEKEIREKIFGKIIKEETICFLYGGFHGNALNTIKYPSNLLLSFQKNDKMLILGNLTTEPDSMILESLSHFHIEPDSFLTPKTIHQIGLPENVLNHHLIETKIVISFIDTIGWFYKNWIGVSDEYNWKDIIMDELIYPHFIFDSSIKSKLFLNYLNII